MLLLTFWGWSVGWLVLRNEGFEDSNWGLRRAGEVSRYDDIMTLSLLDRGSRARRCGKTGVGTLGPARK